jgi:predicted dehydrogenase
MSSTDAPVRVGVIGVGNMGSNHVRMLKRGEVPGATLSAVCDTNPKRLEWARQELGPDVQLFETDEAFFAADACDAVAIATPHYDHPPLAIRGFEKGLHVLIEKPAGVYTRQVREMNEAAETSGRVFAIMYNQRTNGQWQKLRDLVRSGELGEILRTNWLITGWYRSQSYYDSGGWRASWAGEGGGVLLNQCPHNLDLWQWTCGMPKRVRAFCYFGKYHDIEVEDDVTAYVEYENGATGLFITSTGEAPGTNRLELACDRGKVVVEDGEIRWTRTRQSVSDHCRNYKGGFGSPETWNVSVPHAGAGQDHLGILKDWVRGIRTGSDLLAPGVEGINGLMLSNAMHLSAWTNDWVELPIDEELFHQKLQEKIESSTFQKKASGDVTLDVSGTH